jgi:hypothetical protein
VEELQKDFAGPQLAGAAGKNCGRIVEIFSEGARVKSFYNFSTICGKIVEELGACQIRGRIFLTVAD